MPSLPLIIDEDGPWFWRLKQVYRLDGCVRLDRSGLTGALVGGEWLKPSRGGRAPRGRRARRTDTEVTPRVYTGYTKSSELCLHVEYSISMDYIPGSITDMGATRPAGPEDEHRG